MDLYDGSYIEQVTMILSHEHYKKPNLHIHIKREETEMFSEENGKDSGSWLKDV